MSSTLVGAALGALIGVLSAILLRSIAVKVKARNGAGSQSGATMLNMTAIVLFLLLTGMGLFLGPLVMGG